MAGSSSSSTSASSTASSRRCFRILAVYKFVSPQLRDQDVEAIQSEVQALCKSIDAKGCLILSKEGINGTVCYPLERVHDTVNDDNDSSDHDDDDDDNGEDGIVNSSHHHDDSSDPLLHRLRQLFDNLMVRISYDTYNVFFRLKVRIKPTLITMENTKIMRNHNTCSSSSSSPTTTTKNDNDDVTTTTTTENDTTTSETIGKVDPVHESGQYVAPKDWNALMDDPDCWVIDTRNEYEVAIGTFRNATNPRTQNFSDFPQWLLEQRKKTVWTKPTDKTQPNQETVSEQQQQQESSFHHNGRPPQKIAMFCTGGIRCEKATALSQQVFPDTPVYHLKGGILAYLQEIRPSESTFDGECYVFDQRVAVRHGLQPTRTITACFACRKPLTEQDRRDPAYQPGVSCRHCIQERTEKQKERYKARQKLMDQNQHSFCTPQRNVAGLDVDA